MPQNKTKSDNNLDKNRGKNYRNAIATYDRETLHTPADAIAKVKSLAKAKFDETVELAVRLGLDPRKTEQSVRGTVSMPSGTGKSVRIAVFAAAFLQQAKRPNRLAMLVQTSLAVTNSPQKLKKAKWISTSPLQRQT